MSPIKTHGMTPKVGVEWKLFVVDGWQLMAQACENDEGNGWGIRYSTAVEDSEVGVISIWVGNPNDNERTADLFDKAFAEMDEPAARKAIQVLLEQVAPLIGESQ